MWLVPRSELTTEQLQAVMLTTGQHRVIFGSPGSGKTLVLVHRAHHLMTEQRIPANRIHFFSYTNLLKDYIKAGASLLRIPDESITTYDHWCNEYYKAHINPRIPWKDRGPDYDLIREEVQKHVLSHGKILFDAVMVDEGQDLGPEVFRTLKAVSRHITVCLDHKQRIYEKGSEERQILATLGIPKRHVSLIEAYRCTPYIVRMAAAFIRDPEEREQYIRQTRVPQTERQVPLLRVIPNVDEDLRQLAEMIRERQLKGDRVAILYPRQRQVYGYAEALRRMRVPVEVPARRGKSANNTHAIDFRTDFPKVMSYHGSKGLTFDSVFLPALQLSSFSTRDSELIERLIFVGVSRATKWVYISTPNLSALPAQEIFEGLAAEGHMTIQAPGRGFSPSTTGSSPQPKIVMPEVDEDNPF